MDVTPVRIIGHGIVKHPVGVILKQDI